MLENFSNYWRIWAPNNLSSQRYYITPKQIKNIHPQCITITDYKWKSKYLHIPQMQIVNTNTDIEQSYEYHEKVVNEHNNYKTLLKTPIIVCGLDGSYNNIVSEYSICIATEDKTIIYTGGGKCDSHFIATSLYEAEVQGALAITFQLIKYNDIIPPNTTIKFYIDNESVVHELWKLQENILPKPLQPLYEMYVQIMTNFQTIKKNINIFWVKSHQISDSIYIWINNHVYHYANKM